MAAIVSISQQHDLESIVESRHQAPCGAEDSGYTRMAFVSDHPRRRPVFQVRSNSFVAGSNDEVQCGRTFESKRQYE